MGGGSVIGAAAACERLLLGGDLRVSLWRGTVRSSLGDTRTRITGDLFIRTIPAIQRYGTNDGTETDTVITAGSCCTQHLGEWERCSTSTGTPPDGDKGQLERAAATSVRRMSLPFL